jgi:hypothetical protein
MAEQSERCERCSVDVSMIWADHRGALEEKKVLNLKDNQNNALIVYQSVNKYKCLQGVIVALSIMCAFPISILTSSYLVLRLFILPPEHKIIKTRRS